MVRGLHPHAGSDAVRPAAQLMTLVIEFPGEMPFMKLSQNSRGNLHWAQRAKLVDDDKERWWVLTEPWRMDIGMWFLKNEPPYTFDWHVKWKDRRNRDTDNVLSALKTCVDLMVERGYLEDDSASIIRRVSMEQEFGSSAPGTELIISRAG